MFNNDTGSGEATAEAKTVDQSPEEKAAAEAAIAAKREADLEEMRELYREVAARSSAAEPIEPAVRARLEELKGMFGKGFGSRVMQPFRELVNNYTKPSLALTNTP